jgi:hypothetical protein
MKDILRFKSKVISTIKRIQCVATWSMKGAKKMKFLVYLQIQSII